MSYPWYHADDVARENYEKYGHPDGPQALNLVGPAAPFSVQTAVWVQRGMNSFDVEQQN